MLDVELLRPAEWVELEEAKVGSTIYLDLPEQGAVGNARVKSIDPAPPIKPGQGNVVTGIFHQAANGIDLHVEGQANPIGCTDNHPFWSEDRKEFIPAGKLRDGERVLLYNGDIARITQKLPRPGPETEYNLEIWGKHVYCVGNDGALVHNSCGLRNTPDQDALIQLAKEAKQRGGISAKEADVLIEWADEYGVEFQSVKSHPGRNFNIPHIHIGPIDHLPVK